MLETEEIEDDYFTPLPNASLKNIFGSPLQNKPLDGDTLKYTPPKAEVHSKAAATAATECIFACALVAHEWSENAYKSKGKLGLAIIKTTRTNTHSIMLYDSSKTTLSRTIITPNLKVFTKGKLCLSFYDDRHKYWNLVAKDDEILEMVEHLKRLDVQIISADPGETPLQTTEQDKEVITTTNIAPSLNTSSNEQKQSDTDSSLNRRTKVAILNRMASMGQSVLPRYTALETGREDSESSSSTDSHSSLSYTNESPCKATKPNKHSKVIKHINASQEVAEVSKIIQPTDSSLYPVFSSQLVHNVCSNNGVELSCFISDQRISNTELRMNITKTNDKVDQILDLLKNSTCQVNTNNSNFQIDIMNKLISEYESKIKMYELKLKTQPEDTVDRNLVQLLKDYEEKIKMYEEKLQTQDATNTELQNEYEIKLQILTEQLKTEGNTTIKSEQQIHTLTPEPFNVSDMENEKKSLRGKQ